MWQWIQDTPAQGRAVCRALGLTLLVIDGPDPMFWWKWGGGEREFESDGYWN